MRLNNPTQRRRGYKKVKDKQNLRVSFNEKKRKTIQWYPLWMILKGKIEIAHLLPEWSACQEDHFLQT